jgi:hypothetical protein
MRSTHTRWAMFSPLLADQVIDISDMPQSTGSNKHIWRISRLIYPKSLLASCILHALWLKIYLIDISLSISLKIVSSDKLWFRCCTVRSDEDVASPVASPIITAVSKKLFFQKSQTLNSETERARCTRVIFPIKSPKKMLLITLCALRV